MSGNILGHWLVRVHCQYAEGSFHRTFRETFHGTFHGKFHGTFQGTFHRTFQGTFHGTCHYQYCRRQLNPGGRGVMGIGRSMPIICIHVLHVYILVWGFAWIGHIVPDTAVHMCACVRVRVRASLSVCICRLWQAADVPAQQQTRLPSVNDGSRRGR